MIHTVDNGVATESEIFLLKAYIYSVYQSLIDVVYRTGREEKVIGFEAVSRQVKHQVVTIRSS